MIKASHKILALITLSACTSGVQKQDVYFSVRPNGTLERLTKRDPQRGPGIGSLLVQKELIELTLAQGAGLISFDSIRVFGDGRAYAVFGEPEADATNQRRTFQLSPDELAGLVSALNRDRIAHIAGAYHTDVADGVQAFIEVKTAKGRVYSWLNNYFEPGAHTFRYCNDVLWPIVFSARSASSGRGFDRQEAFLRVFGR